nr:MarR family winged helix-turn-helix transcriptional regulator [uncultured Desulfobacter sp.]
MDDSTLSKKIPADEDLTRLFHRAAKMMARMHHRHDNAHHGQSHVYSILKKRGPMNQKDLLNLLNVRSSSLSEILKKLERRGLIVRERNEADKRGFIVSAVPKGEKGCPVHSKSQKSKVDEIFNILEDDEKDQLKTLLGKLIGHMEQTDTQNCCDHKVNKKKVCGKKNK